MVRLKRGWALFLYLLIALPDVILAAFIYSRFRSVWAEILSSHAINIVSQVQQEMNLKILMSIFVFTFVFDSLIALFLIRAISRLERAQEEMRRAYHFADALIDNIPDMIFVKEADELRFVRFNRAGEELLGYDRDQMIGKNDFDFFPYSEASFFTANDYAVLRSGKLMDISEEPIHTRNKGLRTLHTKKIPIRGPSGNPEYLLGISEDITERKYAEAVQRQLYQEKYARAEAEKGVSIRDEFISIASHELKTPLTALRMQLQMLPKILKGTLTEKGEPIYALLDSSLAQLKQFSELVDNLLDVSRASSGRLSLNVARVDLSSTVRNVVQRHAEELKGAACSVSMKLEDGLCGQWDPVRIEQVVTNLLTNAMKYGAGKSIEITTESNESLAKLTVRDHGIGIAPADQERIFKRFERVVPYTKYRGLGLGLFVTREIVREHGGNVVVASKVGQGSTFVVELPKVPAGVARSNRPVAA